MKRALHAFVVAATVWSPTFALAQQPDVAAPAAPLTSDDPAVQALLDSKPSSPDDLMSVIGLLLNLEQPQFAKPLLVKLDQTAADDAQLNALGRKFGSRAVSRLGEVPELQPEGKAFVDKVRTAMTNVARDPARIAMLIGQLKDPSLDVRAAAINNLRLGGDAATQTLVDAVLQAATPADRQAAEVGLAGMSEAALGPLGAMLTSGDEAATASAVTTLTMIDDAVVLNDLYVAAFSPTIPAPLRARAEASLTRRFAKPVKQVEAAGRLYLAAEGLYKKKTDVNQPATTVWTWDAATKRPVAAAANARVDELRRAARYASAADAIGGSNPTVRRLALGAAFESLFWQAADPTQLDASIAAWTAAEKLTRVDYEALYEQAAANDRTMAASWLVRLLSSSAPADQLLIGPGGRPTTLVRAATHPDSTIRFAAVSAIMQLNPKQPFAGSSGVADALAWFAAGEGVDRALVVDSRLSRARDLAGMMIEMTAVRADATDDVRKSLAMAVTEADVQLVIMDRLLLEPSQGNLLARLRADYRTARAAVVVLCDPEDVERTRSRLYTDPYALVFIRPTKPEHLRKQFALNPPPAGQMLRPEGPERVRRAQLALASMRQLLETKNPLFNLRPYEQQLLEVAASPTLAKSAVSVLAFFGSAAAQRALVETANSNARPLDVRQAAASAFCENVIRHGTLLTTDEIQRQYASYNASESLDRPTQELLGAILDAIEARSAKVPTVKSAAAAAAPPPAP